MATSAAFTAAFDQFAREIVEQDYVYMLTPPFEAPTQKTRDEAKAFADRLEREGKIGTYLEATAPKPCECCGRV